MVNKTYIEYLRTYIVGTNSKDLMSKNVCNTVLRKFNFKHVECILDKFNHIEELDYNTVYKGVNFDGVN